MRGIDLFQNKEDLQVLLDLGLTLLGAKIYYALTTKGTTTAKVISQTSGVSRPDVYRTLLKLAKLGLIEKIISNPTLFRAIPPEIAFQTLLCHKTMKLKSVKFKSEVFINKFRNNQVVPISDVDSKFVIVPSQETLINKLKSAINHAKKSIDVVTTCKRFQVACNFLSESLDDAWNRNVNGRVIIGNPEKNQKELFEKVWRKPQANIGVVSSIPPTIMAMYDNKEVFIFIKPTAALKDSPALWSNDPSILCLTQHYFELMWINAVGAKNIQKVG